MMQTYDKKLNGILGEIGDELERAIGKYESMNSAHEGYAVILEELDELWEEVKCQLQDREAIRKEAIQVAAMAVRFVLDISDHGEWTGSNQS